MIKKKPHYNPFMENRGVLHLQGGRHMKTRSGKCYINKKQKADKNTPTQEVCLRLLPKRFLQPHYANNTKQKQKYSLYIFLLCCDGLKFVWPLFLNVNGGVCMSHNDL